ncbi:MAG: hypothetical protein HC893_02715 [Chloroflexaceae bacterium]|nr:hypothetical protein [Chloroflexaceae bacterium]
MSVWRDLSASAAWRETAAQVQQFAAMAPAGDKLADQVLAVAQWIAPHAPDRVPDGSVLQSVRLNVGSARQWGSAATLQEAKDALRTLRELYSKQSELLAHSFDTEVEQRTAPGNAGRCGPLSTCAGHLYQHERCPQYARL